MEPPGDPESSCEPPPDLSEMTGEELAEAKRYGRLDLICALVDKGLDVVYLAVMALLAARPIDAWLGRLPVLDCNWSLRLVVLVLIVIGLHVAVSFPLAYYSGHVLEHRFGLSTQTLAAWLWRYAKRIALAAAFGTLMFLGLFWVIWTTGPSWWLVAAGAFFVVSVMLGQLVPVLILPLFYRIERLDSPELAGRMARLTEGTGLSIEGVYRMALSEETVKANAMLAGLGRTRRVLLGDTLLDHFTPDEIEVIFAHEVGHHVFRHLRKMILAGIVYSALGFWICDRLVVGWAAAGQSPFDYRLMPVHVLPLVMLILTVFAVLLEPLQNAIGRRFERQCDRYSLERTGLREAYLSAFRKLARLNKDDPDPPRWEVLLFHSHPPIGQRLAMGERTDE
jgi:STE24 endopeptidase